MDTAHTQPPISGPRSIHTLVRYGVYNVHIAKKQPTRRTRRQKQPTAHSQKLPPDHVTVHEALPSRSTLRRIQIHMDRALDEAAESEAARRGISKAALIRQALARELSLSKPGRTDPWQAMTGWLEDGPETDLDAVIYDRDK